MTAVALLLIEQGPRLPFPIRPESTDRSTRTCASYAFKAAGPLREFYAFDPRRTAILLIGGDKTGDNRFYERMVPIADALYDNYIANSRKRG